MAENLLCFLLAHLNLFGIAIETNILIGWISGFGIDFCFFQTLFSFYSLWSLRDKAPIRKPVRQSVAGSSNLRRILERGWQRIIVPAVWIKIFDCLLTVTVSCHPSHKLECLLAPYPHASPIRFEKTNLPFLFCGLLMFFCAFESRRVFSIIFSSTNFLCNFEQNHPSISNAAFRAMLRLKTKNAILNSSGYCLE